MVGVSSVFSHRSETVVRCWQYHLAKVGERECPISICIILPDDVLDLRKLRWDVIFAEKINQVVGVNSSNSPAVNKAECLERLKVVVARKILSSELDLHSYCFIVNLQNSHRKRDPWKDQLDICCSSSDNAGLKSFLIKIKLKHQFAFFDNSASKSSLSLPRI